MGTTPKRSPRPLVAVVLAAGKGKRLRSDTPKVLHPVCGRPILWHTLQVVRAAKPSRIVVVVGHGADDVREAVRSWDLDPEPIFVEQAEQLGTGHAVQLAEDAVGKAADVLVANGDFDPITPADRPEAARLPPTHRSRRDPRLHDPRPAGGLRPRGPGRPPGHRRDRGPRRAARGPEDPRGGDELDRVPARPPVRDAAAPRPGEPPARVLPEPGDLDPPRQGRARRRRRVRHRGRPRRQHARRARRAGDADPAPHERVAHGRGHPPDRPGRHVHRRRRADRQGHRRLPEHVPRDRRPDRQGLLDRALRRDRPLADRRPLGRVVLGPRGRPGRQGLRGGAVRPPAARGGPGGRCPRRELRRGQGLPDRQGLEGQAPHLHRRTPSWAPG